MPPASGATAPSPEPADEEEALLAAAGPGGQACARSPLAVVAVALLLAAAGACGLAFLVFAQDPGPQDDRMLLRNSSVSHGHRYESSSSCARFRQDASCMEDLPSCSGTKCLGLRDFIVYASTKVDRGGHLTGDDLDKPHAVFCQAIGRKPDDSLCQQAYEVIEKWQGLGVKQWVQDYALDPGTNGWGITYKEICTLQYRYAAQLPSYERMKSEVECKACQACNKDCYKLIEPLWLALENEYNAAVKPMLRNMVQTVAWIKYTQRVANSYSVNKACHDVMDNMEQQPSPPDPHASMADLVAKGMDQLFKATMDTSKVFLRYMGAGPFVDAFSSMLEIYSDVVVPIMSLNAADPSNPFKPNPMSPLYIVKGKLDYTCDDMHKYYLMVYDNFADQIRNQTAVVIQSAWGREKLSANKVSFGGTQSAKIDQQAIDNGYCADPSSTEAKDDSIGFRVADYTIRYTCYKKLFPLVYQICAESQRTCGGAVKTMFDWKTSCHKTSCAEGQRCLSPSDSFDRGCDEGDRSTCVRLDLASTRLLWDQDWKAKRRLRRRLDKKAEVARKVVDTKRANTSTGALSLDPACHGWCGNGRCPGPTDACNLMMSFTQSLVNEIDDVQYKGWFCGFEDAFNQGDRGQAPMMPTSAVLDELDHLLQMFSGYDNKTGVGGYANMSELFAPQIAGNDKRIQETDQEGWRFFIRRLPDGAYQSSKYAAALARDNMENKCTLKGEKRTAFSQGCCGSLSCKASAWVPAEEGGLCNPVLPQPCVDESLHCGEREGFENMGQCCKSVNDQGECVGLPSPDTLPVGACLKAEHSLKSENGQWEARLQVDGNLVVNGGDGPSWDSGSAGGGGKLCMQRDGNTVISTDGHVCAFFAHGSQGMKLVMQNDGNLVVFQNAPTIQPLVGRIDGNGAMWTSQGTNRGFCMDQYRGALQVYQ